MKVVLNNLFPAGICDMICDYNTHCFKCNNLIFKENESNRYAYERHTTTEEQIDFFQSEMPTPICLNMTGKDREKDEETDRHVDGHTSIEGKVQAR